MFKVALGATVSAYATSALLITHIFSGTFAPTNLRATLSADKSMILYFTDLRTMNL